MKRYSSGYIHSIETMGLVDGPNIRIVVFMQGCPLRCAFCHNPDTWKSISKLKMKANEVVDEIRKYRPYIEMGGGVTFSGGEPLLQVDIDAFLGRIKELGYLVKLDTNGSFPDKLKKIVE